MTSRNQNEKTKKMLHLQYFNVVRNCEMSASMASPITSEASTSSLLRLAFETVRVLPWQRLNFYLYISPHISTQICEEIAESHLKLCAIHLFDGLPAPNQRLQNQTDSPYQCSPRFGPCFQPFLLFFNPKNVIVGSC